MTKNVKSYKICPNSPETQQLTVCTVDSKTSLDILRSNLEQTLRQHGYNPQSTQQDSTQYPKMLLIYSGIAHGTLGDDIDDSDETTQGEQEDYHILRIALNATCPEVEYTVIAPPDETERRYVSPGLAAMALRCKLRHIIG